MLILHDLVRLNFQFVPFPREIWDDNIELTQAEFRLLGWFCCHLKFGVAQMELGDEDILNGFARENRSFPAAGISKNSLRSARTSLVEKELLVAEKLSDGGGRGNETVWRYKLNLSEVDTFPPKPSKPCTQTLQGLTSNPAKVDGFEGVISGNRESTEESEGETIPENLHSHQYAAKIIEDLQVSGCPILNNRQSLEAVSGLHAAIVKGKRSPVEAYLQIWAKAAADFRDGVMINAFYFIDGQKGRNETGKQQLSASASRSQRSAESLAHVLRKRIDERTARNQG